MDNLADAVSEMCCEREETPDPTDALLSDADHEALESALQIRNETLVAREQLRSLQLAIQEWEMEDNAAAASLLHQSTIEAVASHEAGLAGVNVAEQTQEGVTEETYDSNSAPAYNAHHAGICNCGNAGYGNASESDSEAYVRIVICNACATEKPEYDITQLECPHKFCSECIVHLFEAAVHDESLFPPRCKRVEEKAAEKADLDRTYCADSSCSKYILPQFIAEKVATCPVCKHKTCSLCKETTHEGACKENKYDMLLQLAKKQGWQRCKQCRTLIELKSGCSHITCRCGFELCYTCGQRWKTCGCDVRDDNPMTPEENEEDVLIPFQTMPGSIEDGWPFPATGPVSAAAPTNDTSAATSSSAAPTDDAVAGPSSAAGTNQTSTFSMEFPELDDEIVARARERILQVAREGFHARGGCDHEAGWRYRREGPYFCDPCEESCGQFVMQCRECGLRTCHACWMELSRQR